MVPAAEYEQAHYAALTPRCSTYESDTKPGTLHLVTNQGTLALGRTNFSNAVWQASMPKPAAVPAQPVVSLGPGHRADAISPQMSSR
jgi:hypothetical protein